MVQLPEAHQAQKQNVKNWYAGNKPLVRSESVCYMDCTRGHDHVAFTAKDTDRAGLQTLVDITIKAFPNIARHVSQHTISLERRSCTLADSPYTQFLDPEVSEHPRG